MTTDWLNLDPPPLGVNVIPLFPGDDHPVAKRPHLQIDLPPQSMKEVTEVQVDPWVEQEAELSLHRPWCGVHDDEVGHCTDGCLDHLPLTAHYCSHGLQSHPCTCASEGNHTSRICAGHE